MPDLLAHYASSVLLAKTRLGLKESLTLRLVALLPDVDALLRLHRWVTHSLTLTLAVALPLLALTYKYKRRHFETATLGTTIYILHIVLDLFTGPTPILYPLTDPIWIKIQADGLYSDGGITITPRITVKTAKPDFTPQPAIEGPVVSERGIALATTTAATLLTSHLTRRKTKRKP